MCHGWLVLLCSLTWPPLTPPLAVWPAFSLSQQLHRARTRIRTRLACLPAFAHAMHRPPPKPTHKTRLGSSKALTEKPPFSTVLWRGLLDLVVWDRRHLCGLSCPGLATIQYTHYQHTTTAIPHRPTMYTIQPAFLCPPPLDWLPGTHNNLFLSPSSNFPPLPLIAGLLEKRFPRCVCG